MRCERSSLKLANQEAACSRIQKFFLVGLGRLSSVLSRYKAMKKHNAFRQHEFFRFSKRTSKVKLRR